MTSAAWFDQLAGLPEFRGALRRIEQVAAADVSRGGPLPTPITNRWRARGTGELDLLWKAAVHETAAAGAVTIATRIRHLSIARALVASATGQLASVARAA